MQPKRSSVKKFMEHMTRMEIKVFLLASLDSEAKNSSNVGDCIN